MLTVIMSSYNYGRYIRQAIESVLGQSTSEFELIVVDDGSTDDSKDVIDSITDTRFHRLFQENLGQAAAWNNAFARSSGHLVFFIDSDDWWEPTKLESMTRLYELSRGKCGVLQHNLAVHRDGNVYPYRRILPTGDCFEEMKATGQLSFFVTTTGLGFSRRVLERIFPLPTSLRISPDAFLTRTAFTMGPVFSHPEMLGHLRLHGKNAGMTQPQEFHDRLRHELIFPELNAYYERNGIDYRFRSDNSRHSSLLRRLQQRWKS